MPQLNPTTTSIQWNDGSGSPLVLGRSSYWTAQATWKGPRTEKHIHTESSQAGSWIASWLRRADWQFVSPRAVSAPCAADWTEDSAATPACRQRQNAAMQCKCHSGAPKSAPVKCQPTSSEQQFLLDPSDHPSPATDGVPLWMYSCRPIHASIEYNGQNHLGFSFIPSIPWAAASPKSNRGGAGQQHGMTWGLLDAWLVRKEQPQAQMKCMFSYTIVGEIQSIVLPVISAALELWLLAWAKAP